MTNAARVVAAFPPLPPGEVIAAEPRLVRASVGWAGAIGPGGWIGRGPVELIDRSAASILPVRRSPSPQLSPSGRGGRTPTSRSAELRSAGPGAHRRSRQYAGRSGLVSTRI